MTTCVYLGRLGPQSVAHRHAERLSQAAHTKTDDTSWWTISILAELKSDNAGGNHPSAVTRSRTPCCVDGKLSAPLRSTRDTLLTAVFLSLYFFVRQRDRGAGQADVPCAIRMPLLVEEGYNKFREAEALLCCRMRGQREATPCEIISSTSN